jgi:hypothetical protein
VLRPSIVEKPVSMKSCGRALATGFIGNPVIGAHLSGTYIGNPSIGWNEPPKARFSTASDSGARLTASVNTTRE